MGIDSMRLSDNSLNVGISMKKNQSFSPVSALEEKTNKKSPVFK